MIRDDAIETSETSLTIRRTFDAPRARVFRAFVDPSDIEAWQSIGNLSVEVHELTPEPGGSLSISHMPGEDRFVFEGEFLEVVKNERLVHTFRVVEGPITDANASRITVEFRDVTGGSLVVFTEDQVDPAMMADTVATWDRMLDKLATVVSES